MDDRIREKHKKVLAEYQKLVKEWPLKPTIEKRMAAFKEAQEMEPRARVAEECLTHETLPAKEQRPHIWTFIHQKPKHNN
jgi:hypothetical protein